MQQSPLRLPWLQIFGVSGLLALLLCTNLLVAPRVAHAAAATQCSQYILPVHTSLGDLVTYHVAAWLCYQQAPGTDVQVLVHGGTYNHSYWDFACSACQSDTYSYVQYMAQAGYTTFSYDRLGYGQSDRPLPELVTVQMAAYILSQLMTDLKTGAGGLPTFRQVVLVGHSIGSAVVVDEAADAMLARPDGVILSAFLHFVDPTDLATIMTMVEPAFLDPNPRFRRLLPGYLTTDPGTRGQIFYYQPDADPNVIATDETTKDTVADSELVTFFTLTASTLSLLIDVPVLEAVGQYDSIFCVGTFDCSNTSAVQQYEAAFFSPAAQLQTIVIPQAGHDLNLQENATTVWYPQVTGWLQAHAF